MTEHTAEIDACDFCHLPEHRHPVDGCPGFEPEVSGDTNVDDTEESCPRCGHPSLDHYRGFCHHPAGAVAMCGCRTIPPEESP